MRKWIKDVYYCCSVRFLNRIYKTFMESQGKKGISGKNNLGEKEVRDTGGLRIAVSWLFFFALITLNL